MIELKKALTFSYDDGVTQDERLIKILNKYGLKGTFNLNSELLGKQGERIYEGHEVAAHTLTHPTLQNKNDEEIIRQVEKDRENLSKLVEYDIKGMAYPNCAPDERVVGVVKEKTGVKYARNIHVTYKYNPSVDMLNYHGTVYHHQDWNCLFEIGKKFLCVNTETPQIMYVWGHSYEFDIYPERWEQFEKFCEMMSKRNDIFYGTNIEVFEKFGLV